MPDGKALNTPPNTDTPKSHDSSFELLEVYSKILNYMSFRNGEALHGVIEKLQVFAQDLARLEAIYNNKDVNVFAAVMENYSDEIYNLTQTGPLIRLASRVLTISGHHSQRQEKPTENISEDGAHHNYMISDIMGRAFKDYNDKSIDLFDFIQVVESMIPFAQTLAQIEYIYSNNINEDICDYISQDKYPDDAYSSGLSEGLLALLDKTLKELKEPANLNSSLELT